MNRRSELTTVGEESECACKSCAAACEGAIASKQSSWQTCCFSLIACILRSVVVVMIRGRYIEGAGIKSSCRCHGERKQSRPTRRLDLSDLRVALIPFALRSFQRTAARSTHYLDKINHSFELSTGKTGSLLNDCFVNILPRFSRKLRHGLSAFRDEKGVRHDS